jgi:hypothetical protein
MKVGILSVEYKCTIAYSLHLIRGLGIATKKLVHKTRHGECRTDAVITTLGSNYIIRTHKQRLRNKRELPFRCNHR